MAKKLRTFLTSIGFFEQAVAAPSMKAAIEAWGSGPNLFRQGFAKETDNSAIVTATMAQPSVVLRRAVGSKGAFTKDARLPKSLPGRPSKEDRKPPRSDRKPGKAKSISVINAVDAHAAKRAAAAYEKEQARREKEDEKKERARKKERKRRDAQVRQMAAALEAAEQRHDEKLAAIARDRDALNHREKMEDERWQKEKRRLQQERV
jgi:colicin import membrane protein